MFNPASVMSLRLNMVKFINDQGLMAPGTGTAVVAACGCCSGGCGCGKAGCSCFYGSEK